ncbi:alpha/beta hydrolase [Fructilactobacillus frigidiflavus]|uniref:alpha/beta hydrolase n=1 Tax=Fructilactobacillus frigidiflavus TaxID=3242688 RepID=UPI0037576E83
MKNNQDWAPTTAEYYHRLKQISPNYDVTNFKRNDDNLLVNKKSLAVEDSLDSYTINFDKSRHGHHVARSLATERAKNDTSSPEAQKALAERELNGCYDLDLSYNVVKSEIDINDAILYQYDFKNEAVKKPAFIYFHGGNFYGNTPDNTENFGKKLAELTQGLVFNVDYPRTPEADVDALTKAAWHAVEYVATHAEALHVDPKRIFVTGDSAGGNIAAVMSNFDVQKETGYISGQVLIYPMLDVENVPTKQKLPSMDEFGVQLIEKMDDENIASLATLKAIYPGKHQMSDAIISPINSSEVDLAKAPRTMVVAAEYDCLTPQGYTYAKSVAKTHNDVDYIWYAGMMHGFVTRMGIIPQAEDLAREMALWAKR